jgi:hypothetical protein
MATQILYDKLQTEQLTVEFDMLSRLKVGETVATAAVSATVWSGTDAFPSTIISGLPTITGSLVGQKIVGGLPGVIYLVSCAVRSSSNNILINEAKLAVRPSSATTPP